LVSRIKENILRNLSTSNYKFIYVSPERLHNYYFRAALIHSSMKINMVVIDEAHCISQWGFDFRPDYGEINSFIKFLEQYGHKPVICALTATLSPKADKDIRGEFRINEVIYSGYDELIRPELKLNTLKVDDSRAEETKWDHIIDFLKKYNSKKALIYFYSRNKSEELSERFNNEKPIHGLTADYFHASMDGSSKLDKYSAYKNGEINILFATTAFGMGMNIRDIDTIIQYHLPKSIEEYYQQVGRGARDKTICPECNCLLFWSDKNIKSNKNEIEAELCTEEKINKSCEHLDLNEKDIGAVSSISYSELQNAKINLPKFKFYFEKVGLIQTLGEMNGGPNTIRFIHDTPFWEDIKKNAVGNSFIIASKKMKKTVQELINYVYDEDLKGNVQYLPAMERNIFIKK
jgi:ATP-dependent DNA helicase RecQ